jgi:phosphohistidine phosphatase SixA
VARAFAVALLLTALAALLPQPSHGAAAASPLQGRALVQALRSGGYVLYFRHAATIWTQTDEDPPAFADCATQRNLSPEGRADARRIGAAIRRLRIPVGRVLSSAYCRTRQTALLAFGRARVTTDITGLPAARSDAERARRVRALRNLLATPPERGTNTVLVSHLFNLQEATGVSIEEGEAAIFRPRADGGFRLVATVVPRAWNRLLSAAGP